MCIDHYLGDGGGGTSLPSTSKLKDLIRKMYADNTDSIDEILTIKIPHQVSVGMECYPTIV